jgi:hypothetical protein
LTQLSIKTLLKHASEAEPQTHEARWCGGAELASLAFCCRQGHAILIIGHIFRVIWACALAQLRVLWAEAAPDGADRGRLSSQ